MLKLVLEGEVLWDSFLEKGLHCFILELYLSSLTSLRNNLAFNFYYIRIMFMI